MFICIFVLKSLQNWNDCKVNISTNSDANLYYRSEMDLSILEQNFDH